MQRLIIYGFITLFVFSFYLKIKSTIIENNMSNPATQIVTDSIYFGGGCFWCTEALFQRLEGVVSVTSGYGGGFVENPTYKEICNSNTGDAEINQIVYYQSLIAFDYLLEVFW
ncbi:MAG: peptide-methionine (S)-S-oxide reductase, partial [Chitinophagaceae bacterium]|nr:peptide-methionine (S)-S-oxide reductase [Chitinophagaceae bacterium]